MLALDHLEVFEMLEGVVGDDQAHHVVTDSGVHPQADVGHVQTL